MEQSSKEAFDEWANKKGLTSSERDLAWEAWAEAWRGGQAMMFRLTKEKDE